MSVNIGIIGGDLRNIELIKILKESYGHQLYNKLFIYGLDNSEELQKYLNKVKEKTYLKNDIIFSKNIIEFFKNIEIIVGPIPFSKDGKNINNAFSNNKITIEVFSNNLDIKNKKIITGGISDCIINTIKEKNDMISIEDITKNETFAIMNALATAEGTIKIAIENTNKILQGCKILILGFGRIGKQLAKKFMHLGTSVTCTARRDEDIAWIKALGYKSINIKNSYDILNEKLNNFDIIINTVPHLILTKNSLRYIKKDCLLIELASKPGGIDIDFAKREKIKIINAQGLPGKIAPYTSAEIIKNEIEKSLTR